jgi:hypothetical protein
MPMARRDLFGFEITAAKLARAGSNALELSKQQHDCDQHDLGRTRHADF